MRLQHTSVVRMLSYANDKCTGCQTMGQLCKEFFHQQRQKKLQPLNKFSNNSLLDRTVFTCRTGTKFPYGKNHPTAHPGSSAGGWKGGSLGVGPGDTVSGSCFLSTLSQLQCLPQGVERWPSPVHAWMGGRLTQPGKRVAHGPWSHHSPLNNTILPPKIKSVFM